MTDAPQQPETIHLTGDQFLEALTAGFIQSCDRTLAAHPTLLPAALLSAVMSAAAFVAEREYGREQTLAWLAGYIEKMRAAPNWTALQ